MQFVDVEIPGGAARKYEVVIGISLPGAVADDLLRTFDAPRWAVITDTNVGPLYGEPLAAALRKAGARTDCLTFPAGEEAKTRATVGELDFFYETTLLVADAGAAAASCARIFALDPKEFVPIASEQYGYAGSLTLFDRDRLGRFEVITPSDADKTMGRFFARFGESFYMAFAESHALAAIEERARELNAGFTVVPPNEGRPGGADTVFLHASGLGGMMLGISRPTQAWQWSGHPERVEPHS